MTYLSYFFIILSVASVLAAVIMYLAFDIRKCWRIIASGNGCRKNVINAVPESLFCEKSSIKAFTEKLTAEKTLPLDKYASEMLLMSEETVPLTDMCLVQDIVMGEIWD